MPVKKNSFGYLCVCIMMVAGFFLDLQVANAQTKEMDPAAIANLKKQVRETALKTLTLSCNFTQEKEMSMIAEKIVSGGKFYLKKEKMLRWEYLKPFSYLIIFNNDHITIKDESKVTRFNTQTNKLFLEINRVILGSIQGTLLDDTQNFSARYSETPSACIVKLKTLSPRLKESLSEITIWFDRKDYSVSSIVMHEPGGDQTKITFSARSINQPIPDEKFIVQ